MLKKIYGYLITLIVISLIVGCEEKPTFESKIFLNKTDIVAPSASSSQTVQVLTNSAWEVAANVDWILFAGETTGEKGLFNLDFQISQNTEVDERVGMVTFVTAEGVIAEIHITQQNMGKENIYVKVDGVGKGLSWSDATSLDSALVKAKEGNKIHIAAGIYTPSVILTGADESDEGNKTFFINKNITLIGGYPADVNSFETLPNPEQYVTNLHGDDKYYHVVTISAPVVETEGVKVVLNGLTISNGYTNREKTLTFPIDGNNYGQALGAGIIVANTKLDLLNCNIVNNKAGQAGAIHAFNGVILKMDNCKVNNNYAVHHNAGLWLNRNGKADISNSEFIGNVTDTGIGGGIYAFSNCLLNIFNVNISNNKAGNHGGGLYVRAKSTANIVNTMIANNEITSGNGAGLFIYDNSVVNMISSTVTQNSTPGNSGGIYMQSGQNILTVYNSIISGNMQVANAEDLARADQTATSPVIKATVVQDKTYNNSGNIEATAIPFDPSSMLVLTQNYLYGVAQIAGNPALNFGLTADELISIGSNSVPVINPEIISFDIKNNSRNNLTTMGAFVGN